jgi:hypothetical protein
VVRLQWRTWPFHQTCNSSSHSDRLTTVRLRRAARLKRGMAEPVIRRAKPFCHFR